MWIIYKYTETTNPKDDNEYTTCHIYPKVFNEYQDLAVELSEICNSHERHLALHHARTINNFRVGIPTCEELNSTPIGTDYQAYSISIAMGQHKIMGYIKQMTN